MGCVTCKKVFSGVLGAIRHHKNNMLKANKLVCIVIPKSLTEYRERCETVIEDIRNTFLDWLAKDIEMLTSLCGLANLC